MPDLYTTDADGDGDDPPRPPTDEQRILAAGWLPASRSRKPSGYWCKAGDGRVLGTAAVLAILDAEESEGK